MEAIVLRVACPLCDYETTTLKELECHRSEKHSGSCPHCPNNCTFSDKYNLKHHLVSIHGYSSPYPCTVCHRYFANSRVLKEHEMAKHPNPALTSTYPHKCDYCEQRFHRRMALKTHVTLDHKSENELKKLAKKSFQCAMCSAAFTRQQYLHLHVANCH
jgi:hypothetical protein